MIRVFEEVNESLRTYEQAMEPFFDLIVNVTMENKVHLVLHLL